MAKAYGGRAVTALRRLVWDNYPHVCHYCPTPLIFETFTVEHLVARSNGGTNDLPNLRPACGPCNFGRGNRDMPGREKEDNESFFK